MRVAVAVLFACVVVGTAVVAAAPPLAVARTAYAWMCLDRCGDDVSAELQQLQQFVQSGALTGVSYEAYDLSPAGTLVWANVTRVSPFVRELGITSLPMITTVDIDSMRALWANPQPFIDACVREAARWDYSGYNIDFEPCQDDGASAAAAGTGLPRDDNCTDADGDAYVKFVDHFAGVLHAHGLQLSVDVASWQPQVWHLTALAHTAVDWLGGMDTYAYDWNDFAAALQQNVAAMGTAKLSVGIETDAGPMNITGTSARFSAITSAGAHSVCVWKLAGTTPEFESYMAQWVTGTL